MATLTFSGGSYDDPNDPNLSVTETSPGEYTIGSPNEDGSKSTLELDIEVVDEPINLTIEANIENSRITAFSDDDTLVIKGKSASSTVDLGDGSNVLRSGKTVDSNFSTGSGDDKAKLKGGKTVAKNSDFDSGDGRDTFNFKGNVKNSEVTPGAGKDELIFGGKVVNTVVNLGSDGSNDVIRIKGGIGDIKGLTILGAEEGDLLFIGSGKYEYDSSENRWISSEDPDDSLKF